MAYFITSLTEDETELTDLHEKLNTMRSDNMHDVQHIFIGGRKQKS